MHSKTDEELILEEVSIPSHLAGQIEWKQWMETGAFGHSSWIMHALDVNQLKTVECYSFSMESFLTTESFDSFLTPLLTLDLKEIPREKRELLSPSPRPGEVGIKKPWGPTQYRNGKKVKNPIYDVYEATWPTDASELSGKNLVLYFDKNETHFPFPYWMQLRDGVLKFKMRALDSGEGLVSPQKPLPRRSPYFLEKVNNDEKTLKLFLSAPLYTNTFRLYAVDLTTNPRTTQIVPFKSSRSKEEVTLLIEKKDLESLFIKGHRYVWLATSEEEGSDYIESPSPYTWSDFEKQH